MNDLLLGEFWTAVRARLDSATMQTFTGTPGQVLLAGSDLIPTENTDATDWKRILILPVQTLWPQLDAPGEPRGIGWLVRAEANAWEQRGYDPGVGLGLMQREAYRQLDTWSPTGFTQLRVLLPIYRVTPPDPVPLMDDERHCWYTTSQFRAQVAGVVAA